MADSKVSALTALTTPQPSDELYIIDNSGAPASKKITRQYLLGYTEYVALLTQMGTDDPTATVIKNDTGATVTMGYVGVGSYTLTFSSAVLTANKTIGLSGLNNPIVATLFTFGVGVTATDTVAINTRAANHLPANGLLSNSPIIIRIYV